MNRELQNIVRYGITLRLVEADDAAFILRLRNDETLGRHLSKTSASLEDQINWIQKYKERESRGEEYYFVAVGPENERWGTTRLSELNGSCFELGSWLFAKEAPNGAAIKADIIAKEVGFELLNFKCCTFNVRKENKKVLRYHLHYSPEKIAEDELNVFFQLSEANFLKARERFIKML
ncbi:GNAT family N-acetyltransferase [Pedobacter insulae]|uniref:Protein N-acetyltransferase, RimJ/RimL family n=1 Tax=Pedobacter insulae TaxID=414048 RepID=A0A1I2YRL6_9SPHI|nr:GNAT family N-acetyltransferase [Pedobacter insulae]SFH28208.1 Protein N-acetyltransferase, RimJ/RimL family [Pedobacter insulae]